MKNEFRVCKSDRHSQSVVVHTTIDCPLCLALDKLPEGCIQSCSKPISGLVNPKTGRKFSIRAMNAINNIGAKTLLDLKDWDYYRLRKLRNCGKNTVNEILAMVEAYSNQ